MCPANPRYSLTREGWPLLTVETEAIGDLWSTNERGSSMVGSLGCRVGSRDFYAALVSPAKICFSSPHTYSVYVAESSSKLDRQSCWVACLLVWSNVWI